MVSNIGSSTNLSSLISLCGYVTIITNIHHSLNKKGFETFMSQNNIFSCWKFSEFPFYYFGMGFLLFLCRTQNSNREALSNIKTKIKYVQKLCGQVNNLKKKIFRHKISHCNHFIIKGLFSNHNKNLSLQM